MFNSYIQKKIASYCADIINVHWINRSMISLTELNKFNEKIVISLHDMWFLIQRSIILKKGNSIRLFIKILLGHKKKLINKKNIFFIVHNNWMLNQLKNSYPQLKKKFLQNYSKR